MSDLLPESLISACTVPCSGSSSLPLLVQIELAGIAQLVEQWTFMQGVLGSIPTPNSTWPGLTQPSIPLWVGRMST